MSELMSVAVGWIPPKVFLKFQVFSFQFSLPEKWPRGGLSVGLVARSSQKQKRRSSLLTL